MSKNSSISLHDYWRQLIYFYELEICGNAKEALEFAEQVKIYPLDKVYCVSESDGCYVRLISDGKEVIDTDEIPESLVVGKDK
jgi:hypothetical protein